MTGPHLLLYSRKDLADQTASGPQDEDSFQLHVGAAHLFALGHSPDTAFVKVQTGILPGFWVVWRNLHTGSGKQNPP